MKRALIFGITGQDGSYLAEQLIKKDYSVFGWKRPDSKSSNANIIQIQDQLTLLEGDLQNPNDLKKAFEKIQPDEVYHLGSPSSPGESWEQPMFYGSAIAFSTLHILDAIKTVGLKSKLLIASSSELFGNAPYAPQNESTPFNPRNPYGSAKLYAHHLAMNYRDQFGVFVSSAILFNHESVRRPNRFVTRKITQGAARIKLKIDSKLNLGNMDVTRDWGYAPEFVEAMWLILQQEHPDNFVLGTGEVHTIRNVCEVSFGHLGLDYQAYVVSDVSLQRKNEEVLLMADASKAHTILGWKPQKKFADILKEMVEYDLVMEQQGRPSEG